jgi:hypothetical protein
MGSEGRKDNAEAQRTQSFAEQKRGARLPHESADFASEWESGSDGGLGTSCLPFYAAATWRLAAVNSGSLCRQEATGLLRRVNPWPENRKENTRPGEVSQVLL